MRPLLLLVLLMVTGCAVQPAGGMTGKPRHEVACFDDEKFCDPEAKGLCPDGYRIVDTDSSVVAVWRGVDVINRIRFYLTIECE